MADTWREATFFTDDLVAPVLSSAWRTGMPSVISVRVPV
jgi:hypothetical protein